MTTISLIIIGLCLIYTAGLGYTQWFIWQICKTVTEDEVDEDGNPLFDYSMSLKGYLLLLVWPYYWVNFRRIAWEQRELDNINNSDN